MLISRDGIVKLMDFGIARPTEVSLHTIGGKVMGSLAYLSPEQLEGRDIDHRSDIFSLGSVLYEMITGQRAFPQKTISELVRQKAKGEFAPLESFATGAPASVVELVNKSLALLPGNRFSTAAEMGSALYREFKLLSDQAPADVIYSFVKNPVQWKPEAGAAARPVRKHLSTRQIVALTAAGSVVAISLLFALARLCGLL